MSYNEGEGDGDFGPPYQIPVGILLAILMLTAILWVLFGPPVNF